MDKYKYFQKIFPFQFFFFITLLTISSPQMLTKKEKEFIKEIASKNGYNLTNPKDNVFLDLCAHFTYKKKDVTLEYRQKYFFFPKNNETNINFPSPKINSTYSCFFGELDLKYFIFNITFCIQFPLFLFGLTNLLITLYLSPEKVFFNSPSSQIEAIKQENQIIQKIKNKEYSKFVPESNPSEIITTSKLSFDLSINNLNTKQNNIQTDTNISFNEEDNENDDKTNHDQINKEKEIDEQMNKIKKEQNLNNFDLYTFGNNIQFQENISNLDEKNTKEAKEEKENEEDVHKRIEKFYNLVNDKKLEETHKISNSDLNKQDNINFQTTKETENFSYSNEEYFYFGYPLAIIKDKRSLYQMYFDLLNQCQIVFKLFYITFNIYEDRKLQILHYTFKINCYFLFNIILTRNNVINKIFDGKNNFKDDITRSFFSCIITYFIGLFIYNLTNIKTTLIKRRYKILNLRINNKRLFAEFAKMSYFFCMEYFINKLIILLILLSCFSLSILIMSLGFCMVYRYTQLHILKCVLYSCLISQLSPFILCWIPSFLRKKSIEKKKISLYSFTRLIEYLFVA